MDTRLKTAILIVLAYLALTALKFGLIWLRLRTRPRNRPNEEATPHEDGPQ